MKLTPISEVTKLYHISTRQLRYYDEIGLLKSTRMEGYAYRVYDEESVRRLQQILILRKLRIPLKQIALIINTPSTSNAMNIFYAHILELDQEISALQTIRELTQKLVSDLTTSSDLLSLTHSLSEDQLVSILDTCQPTKNTLKETLSMKKLNEANKILNKLTDVRLVLLPPCTVMSCHVISNNPEEEVENLSSQFVQENNLYTLKPDSRMFGFNHPCAKPGESLHGYEVWITIPDELDVPAPLTKKHIKGGLYAAHTITFPNFQEWELLIDWANNNEKYEPNFSEEGDENMNGCLEEHLNWVYSSQDNFPKDGIYGQIDLLLPIKPKA